MNEMKHFVAKISRNENYINVMSFSLLNMRHQKVDHL